MSYEPEGELSRVSEDLNLWECPACELLELSIGDGSPCPHCGWDGDKEGDGWILVGALEANTGTAAAEVPDDSLTDSKYQDAGASGVADHDLEGQQTIRRLEGDVARTRKAGNELADRVAPILTADYKPGDPMDHLVAAFNRYRREVSSDPANEVTVSLSREEARIFGRCYYGPDWTSAEATAFERGYQKLRAALNLTQEDV